MTVPKMSRTNERERKVGKRDRVFVRKRKKEKIKKRESEKEIGKERNTEEWNTERRLTLFTK